jgi:hypothetical protein
VIWGNAMRKLALSFLIAVSLAPTPVLAASACGGCGLNKGAPGAVAADVDDLLRRIERDLDRLTRGLNNDVAHIEKNTQPKAKPAAESPQYMRR